MNQVWQKLVLVGAAGKGGGKGGGKRGGKGSGSLSLILLLLCLLLVTTFLISSHSQTDFQFCKSLFKTCLKRDNVLPNNTN